MTQSSAFVRARPHSSLDPKSPGDVKCPIVLETMIVMKTNS